MGDSSGPALFLQSSARFEPDGGQLRTRRFHSGNRHGTVQGYAESKKLFEKVLCTVPAPDQGPDQGRNIGPATRPDLQYQAGVAECTQRIDEV